MLLLSRRSTTVKHMPSVMISGPAASAYSIKKHISSLKRSSVSDLKLFTVEVKPNCKLSELVQQNASSFGLFGKLFDKYTVHTNPFDLSPGATQDFASYSAKYGEILETAQLTMTRVVQKLEKCVNQQNVAVTHAFNYMCQQFLIKQQHVIQTIFESEKYICENQAEEALLERILEWNNMDICYSLIYWKYSKVFEELDKEDHNAYLHHAIMSGFKRFKQFLYFLNGVLVNQRSQFQNLIAAFESLQTYAIKAYEILVRQTDHVPGISRKDLELLETIRNMSKDFVSGNFFSGKPFRELNRRATEFFSKINNANETFKFFEEEMEADLLERSIETPSVSRMSFQLDLTEDSKMADPVIDIFNNAQEQSEESGDESIDSRSKQKDTQLLSLDELEKLDKLDLLEQFKQISFYKKYIASKELDEKLVEHMKASPDNPKRTNVPYVYEPEDKKETQHIATATNAKSSMAALFGDLNNLLEFFRPSMPKKLVTTNVSKLFDILEEPAEFKHSSLDLEDKSLRRLQRIESRVKELEALAKPNSKPNVVVRPKSYTTTEEPLALTEELRRLQV